MRFLRGSVGRANCSNISAIYLPSPFASLLCQRESDTIAASNVSLWNLDQFSIYEFSGRLLLGSGRSTFLPFRTHGNEKIVISTSFSLISVRSEVSTRIIIREIRYRSRSISDCIKNFCHVDSFLKSAFRGGRVNWISKRFRVSLNPRLDNDGLLT
jgi:hypothetical protein